MAIDANIRNLIANAIAGGGRADYVVMGRDFFQMADDVIAALKEVGLDLDDYYLDTPPPVQRRLVKRPSLKHPSDIMKDQIDKFREPYYAVYTDEDGDDDSYDAYVGLGGTE